MGKISPLPLEKKRKYKYIANSATLGQVFGPGEGQVARSCEHGNEPTGSMKFENFLK